MSGEKDPSSVRRSKNSLKSLEKQGLLESKEDDDLMPPTLLGYEDNLKYEEDAKIKTPASGVMNKNYSIINRNNSLANLA